MASQAHNGGAPGPASAPGSPRNGADDCRCTCGSLLARLRREGVELRCRRCKRTLLVPLALPPGAARAGFVEVVPVRGGR